MEAPTFVVTNPPNFPASNPAPTAATEDLNKRVSSLTRSALTGKLFSDPQLIDRCLHSEDNEVLMDLQKMAGSLCPLCAVSYTHTVPNKLLQSVCQAVGNSESEEVDFDLFKENISHFFSCLQKSSQVPMQRAQAINAIQLCKKELEEYHLTEIQVAYLETLLEWVQANAPTEDFVMARIASIQEGFRLRSPSSRVYPYTHRLKAPSLIPQISFESSKPRVFSCNISMLGHSSEPRQVTPVPIPPNNDSATFFQTQAFSISPQTSVIQNPPDSSIPGGSTTQGPSKRMKWVHVSFDPADKPNSTNQKG